MACGSLGGLNYKLPRVDYICVQALGNTQYNGMDGKENDLVKIQGVLEYQAPAKGVPNIQARNPYQLSI